MKGIALIGYGYWGKNLARVFSDRLSIICDPNADHLKKAATLFPHVRALPTCEEVFNSRDINAVLIATPPSSHADIAKNAIKAGYDVWIEKPLATSISEIESLQSLAKLYGRIIFTDHTFVYNPAVKVLRELRIGKPLYYDSLRIGMGLFQGDVDALLDLAVHDLSIIDYLYPDITLQSRSIVRFNHVNDKANQVLVNLKFENGFTAAINCNWVSPVKKRHVILCGSDSSVVYDDMDANKLKQYFTGKITPDYNSSQLGSMFAPYIPPTEALMGAREEFLKAIESREPPLTGIDNVMKVMKWIL